MKSTKINPELFGNSVISVHKGFNQNYENQEEYQMVEKESELAIEEYHDVRRQSGYLDARNMFLKSYNLSEDKEGWGKKIKRKAKETNEKAKALVNMSQKAVRGKKFDVNMLALKMNPMSAAIVKCFVPNSYRRP